MLDIKSASLVKEAICKKFEGIKITLEDVYKMQPIQIASGSHGYTIFGLQYGDLTILVWIQFNDKQELVIRRVASRAW